MHVICRLRICLIPLFSLLIFSARSQQAETSVTAKGKDSTWIKYLTRLNQFGAEETVRSIEKFEAGRISIHRNNLVSQIEKTTQLAGFYLKKGIDTNEIKRVMESTSSSLAIVRDGVFVNKGTSQTQRNLSVSAAILTELVRRMNRKKMELDLFVKDLVGFRYRIDSLSADSVLYSYPDDSLSLAKYINKLRVVVKEIGPIDTALDKALNSVQDLQNSVDLMIFELGSGLEEVELYRKELSGRNFTREFPNIWGPVGFSRPFREILQFSYAKEKLVLEFYVNANKGKLFFIVILIGLASLFIRSLKKHLVAKNNLATDFKGQLVVRYPVLSAIIIVLNIFQFIFFDPPFILSFWFWLISAVCLAIIFRKFITPFWMTFWLILTALFVLASADNFFLQASRTERWLMLGLSFFGMSYGTYILSTSRKTELRERKILYFIAFVVVLEAASICFNAFGRFNLSKTLLATGYVGVVIAILFLWTARLINEALGLASEIYKQPDRKLFHINFDRVGGKVPAIFYVFLIVGWFILIGRNFYSFKLLTGPLNEFLTNERTIGDYTFTVSGMFIFLFILICSLFLSRIVSFFAADPVSHDEDDHQTGKVGIGSWLLLVRIFIISTGLFLALAAAGIPLDKITIILGALGVGIGLGLQGLVNNLVSGLIIAFEKPINVGDNIEVNGKQGKVKSIGFRSSVVTLSDGACLIIPNGDLLSQHLVNWTMGKNKKKISLPVSVAYGSDLEKVKDILSGILYKEERILKSPAPGVVAKDFSQSSIDFEIQYWVSHIREASAMRSDLIYQIDKAFKQEGIVIPYPQQDLHIKSMEGPGNA